MPESTGRPSFQEIYRQQYRLTSASPTSKAFRIITPVVLIAAALLTRHSPVIPIVLAALAVILLAVTIILSRRQRHDPAEHPADAQPPGPGSSIADRPQNTR